MAFCGKMFVNLVIIVFLGFHVSGDPIADTKYGQVRGVYSDTGQEGLKVTYFRGIKYTEPMVGDLRFELPVEIKPWSPEIYDATVFGPSCPQYFTIPEWMAKALPNYDISEDCLLLNIYVPGHTLQPANTYPVMVWIHGGGFDIGQGMLYESTFLAGAHGVIVVTINYRLGAFGWLSTGDEHSPGNFGLHDQIMSLQWVQENIANFGGDPTQVTIFGESAGGISTGILAHSPKAANLFHRVISQSGVFHPGFIIPIERATDFAYNVGYTANCNTTENPDLTDHYLLIECLRNLTWEELFPPETNTYHYYFDHRPSFYKGPDYIDGAAHATEIPFTFGHLMMTGIGPFENMTAPADEKQLSLDMSRYWTNFAKSGDPNLPVAVPVQWPLYDNTLYTYMRFEPNMTIDNVRENLRADGTAFWNEYVPILLNLTCPPTTPCSQSTSSGAKISFNQSEEDAEVDVPVNGLLIACVCLLVVGIALAVALVVVVKRKPRRRSDDQIQLHPNNKNSSF
uniref:Carboxylic ester hydrolase n=1 Tax=Saccoglossus kowalevskii TaxID=10224 RepID=A0ABM0GJS4_SACKO|nr:PREDICTED: carboxylesterase 5A-like [Saccoglossus kowalevskii]